MRLSRFFVGAFAASVLSMLVVAPAEAKKAAQPKCWDSAYGGIKYCKGAVQFDGGGDFAGSASRKVFLRLARSGPPKNLNLAPGSAGVLRWAGGDCVYTHGASGNWTVWCGTRAEMAVRATKLMGDNSGGGATVIAPCKAGSVTTKPVDSNSLTLAYPELVCKAV